MRTMQGFLGDVFALVRDGHRYRFLREQALNPRLGLESFVAMQQLDHIGDAAKFDTAVDIAMKGG